MLLTVSLIFFSIMLLLGINGMTSTPVTVYESVMDGEKLLGIKEVMKVATYITLFFAIFQSVPVLIHHFAVESLPLYLFLAVVLHAMVNIYDLGNRFRDMSEPVEETKTKLRNKALEFDLTKRGKVKYYGTYIIYMVLRLVIIFGLINILFF